ncbi:fumarate reductase flavoprotein subunit [Apilactobacillus ozensis DSM 23829 = JCM 17196]|uniref:Fumarate reductase flavoprotein subunit n=1 Tax=Apilactobacillus ozensis DSM 23829 = JCM 17196 TaxID=1423781 RepID=A0A0R2ATM7_9LACO|nr:flavocytochrome c [Apilactobacillus ozensis]KRM69962.1 fumarate reductase flavoprotein subunit [Apilactobacillus ozensis DSM 23829 = JCM 17196]
MAKYIFKPTAISQLSNNYDVVIIGSGATGLVSAIQAYELGLKPVIIEKMDTLGGNTNRASSGMNAAETSVQLKNHIVDSYEDFYNDTFIGGGKTNDPDLLKYFTTHAALSIDWLADHGIKLDSLTITGGMKTRRTHRPDSMAPIGNFLITSFLKIIEQYKIPVFNNTKVSRLLSNDNVIQGVELKLPDASTKVVNTKSIILATGGFGANKELIKKYRNDLTNYRTTNQDGATGDGLGLAQQAGASLVDMQQIQVHPTVYQETSHTYLIGEAVRGEGAILVNQMGQRFVNELDTRQKVTDAINNFAQGSAYLIFDSNVRKKVPAIEFYDMIGAVVHGSDLEELADNINVDSKILADTVSKWNHSVSSKTDALFNRSTGMNTLLNASPYYAIHIAPAVHYTMGGVKINHKAQVLNEKDDVIKGLFAGGEVTGGLHGNNRIGGNSIAETIVFGRQAGQQAFKYLSD